MVKVITIGCRLNQAEGDSLHSIYSNDTPNNHQITVVNTCAVTHEAVRTSWKIIRRYIKRETLEAQNSKLIVTGCLATLERKKMIGTPGIDVVVPQDEKVKILDLLLKSDIHHHLRGSRSRPLLKIQDGCPNDCSFCIARLIRGKPKSILPEQVLKKINGVTGQGYQEIVLTGLNLGYYGVDIDSSLTNLLNSINQNSFRIRLSSIEPDTITDGLLDLFKTKRLCRHLHIPLQSGDARVLQLMHRKYTIHDYRRLIDKITKKIPGINIGTDIIVGFPYEDEKAFNNTLKLAKEMPFGYLHVFPYSPRPGTEAAKLPDTIKAIEKKGRVHILRALGQAKKQEFRDNFIGNSLEVLVEENNDGLSDNYIRIKLPQDSKYQKRQLYNINLQGGSK